MFKEQIIEKIKNKKAVIGVIGLGYVGLPLSLRFVEMGFKVLGFDIDLRKVQKLNRGETYIKHISQETVYTAWKTGRFTATNQFEQVNETDALIICLPTPLGKHQEPDLSFIHSTIQSLLPYLRQGQIISLESTTYPGTTEEEIKPKIESKGFKIGEDIFLVYSPEREDPGNENFSTKNIPKIVGGTTKSCLEVGIILYSMIVEQIVPVSSTQTAEMVKILENIYRAVNIGLINELKILAIQMGIDIWEVIEAAKTKPFGFMPFYPGPGLGGHCIPIDPFYLTWKAREYDLHTRFIELAGEINTMMPYWVVSQVMDALNNHGKALKKAKILVLGISYKKNIDDTRESPSVELIKFLIEKGGDVFYSDPYVPIFPEMRKYKYNLQSIDINPESLSQMDCVIISSDHDVFDYTMIQNNSKLIIDTRGRYREKLNNVIKA
ncbi:nucleotide sugar dehydrogenase [Aphanizomenon sp. CS-733/32]|uniref:nucleotide sugar dehydrogenase n=1 Tax=Aphanizomenon sp. CS-733/32 TaxID=3021715 RepID=UPI00232E9D57|nr:nucleotide sugar dehydrogenase [Aphanizomenon sp. CS-733/32]MDB9309556.1 nucleotide sugar dehydrogenase [Aphanizomenon sp. CS-733/32]